jgi:hypothetical protein
MEGSPRTLIFQGIVLSVRSIGMLDGHATYILSQSIYAADLLAVRGRGHAPSHMRTPEGRSWRQQLRAREDTQMRYGNLDLFSVTERTRDLRIICLLNL